MLWSMPYASTAVSVAFYSLGIVTPSVFGLVIARQKNAGANAVLWRDRLESIVQDVSVAALATWLAYIVEPLAPDFVSALLYVCIGLAAVSASVDVMLMTSIGARLEPQLLSYAADLNTVGGSRWRGPLAGALICGLAVACTACQIHNTVPRLPVFVLFGLSCLFVPMLVLARKVQSADLWRVEGPLWRWVHIGIVAPLLGLRRQQAATGPAAVCVPAQEQYTVHDPCYPLWRDTHAWGGTRTVPWSMPKGHKPHVIMIVMESMGAMDTGCIGRRESVTPCFDLWSEKGALFTRHYATGHSTSRSMMSALYGVLPGLRARPTIKEENPAYLSGLPQLFGAHGYDTRYLQGAPLFFDDKEPYFLKRGFSQVGGAEALYELYPEAESGTWNAPHDGYLFDAHATWLLEKAHVGQPTFSTLLTITNHDPWEIPRAWRTGALADDATYAAHIASKDPKILRDRCRIAMRYADAQLGIYLDRLEKAGVLKQSIVMILGDTGQQYDDEHISTQVGGYLRDEAYHVPLLLLAPQYLSQAKRFEHVTSQIDVPPTLMDLMGWHGPHHSMGQSLVRTPQRQSAYFTQPHSPSLLSMRCAQWRSNVAIDDSRTSLYDIERDPLEKENLAASQTPRVEGYRREMKAIQDAAMRLHQQDAFCPPVDGSSAVRLQHLAKAVYFFAPEGLNMPQTIAELQALIESPVYMQDTSLLAYQNLAARVLRTDLPSADHLRLMQLKLQHMYMDTFGEPDWRAIEEYTRLYNGFAAAERDQEVRVYDQVQEALRRMPKLGG